MAILQMLLTLAFRSIGKLLNTAFGWATIMLFGKVPRDRQIYLTVIAFASLVWLIVALGILLPEFATFLLAFVTLPDWVNKNWIRLAMLASAVVVPPVVGALSLFLLNPAARPRGAIEKGKVILKGYFYTFGLAITLLMMVLLAPLMKLRDILQRWKSTHVPILVESKDYPDVLDDIQQALRVGGLPTTRKKASWMLRWPTKVLTLFAGRAVERLVADRLMTLRAPSVEILLHPSDLVIRGRELDVSRARAILTEQLTFTKAHLTWSKGANELEDRLLAIWKEMKECARRTDRSAAAVKLQAIEGDLRKVRLPYEEWEVLFRAKLQVERGLLQVAAGLSDKPHDLTEAPPEELSLAAAELDNGRHP